MSFFEDNLLDVGAWNHWYTAFYCFWYFKVNMYFNRWGTFLNYYVCSQSFTYSHILLSIYCFSSPLLGVYSRLFIYLFIFLLFVCHFCLGHFWVIIISDVNRCYIQAHLSMSMWGGFFGFIVIFCCFCYLCAVFSRALAALLVWWVLLGSMTAKWEKRKRWSDLRPEYLFSVR